MDSSLLLFFIGAVGWPLLAFCLCRFSFGFSDQWTLRCVIIAFGLAGVFAIGLGDNIVSSERAGQSSASLFLLRGLVFALPYAALAVWVGARFFARIRHDRSTPTI